MQTLISCAWINIFPFYIIYSDSVHRNTSGVFSPWMMAMVVISGVIIIALGVFLVKTIRMLNGNAVLPTKFEK